MSNAERSPKSSRGIVGAIAGVIVGSLTTMAIGMSWAHGEDPPPPPIHGSSARAASRPQLVPSADPRLEQRLRRLESMMTQPTEPAATSDEAPQQPVPGGSEEEREALRERNQERFGAFEEQVVDERWRASTELPLQQDLARVRDALGFQLERVECRGDACMVEVHWPDAARAREGTRALVHEPLRINCARSILIDEDAPEAARILLDCASWKAEGSTLLAELPPAHGAAP